MSETVLLENRGAVAIMTLNRPESMNAMNPEMLDTMFRVARQAADDPAIRCLVITGNGRAFSAGGDVKAMASGNADGSRSGPVVSRVDVLRQQEEVSRLLAEMPKPTICAVNGVAAGAGLSVALAADLRVASDQSRYTTAFAKVGFSGDFGGTWLLQRLVGPLKAKELYFLSEVISAQQALDFGTCLEGRASRLPDGRNNGACRPPGRGPDPCLRPYQGQLQLRRDQHLRRHAPAGG